MATKPPKKPPYRISVRPASLSEAETEIRLRKAFDILLDELLRQRSENPKKSRHRKSWPLASSSTDTGP
jgi:hypothetical protein